MVGWLQTTMGVLQATVGAADFLDKAAEALVQIVGLELGRVLLLDGDQWVVAAAYPSPPTSLPKGAGRSAGRAWRRPEPAKRARGGKGEERRPFGSDRPLRTGKAETPSLAPLQTVVAAPLLDAGGAVVGALYGERHRAPASPLHAGGPLEAMLVDLLACGVAAGLARQSQEKVAR